MGNAGITGRNHARQTIVGAQQLRRLLDDFPRSGQADPGHAHQFLCGHPGGDAGVVAVVLRKSLRKGTHVAARFRLGIDQCDPRGRGLLVFCSARCARLPHQLRHGVGIPEWAGDDTDAIGQRAIEQRRYGKPVRIFDIHIG
ncbi:hypothetical protein D3C81_1356500 [compost metagenome]